MSSARSKVRVRILSQTLQDAMRESNEIYIAGHIMSDFDCMGACLSISSWARTLKKNVYIVLKDVPRDAQLQSVMDALHSSDQRKTYIYYARTSRRTNGFFQRLACDGRSWHTSYQQCQRVY